MNSPLAHYNLLIIGGAALLYQALRKNKEE